MKKAEIKLYDAIVIYYGHNDVQAVERVLEAEPKPCLYMGKNRHVRHGDTALLKIDTGDRALLKSQQTQTFL